MDSICMDSQCTPLCGLSCSCKSLLLTGKQNYLHLGKESERQGQDFSSLLLCDYSVLCASSEYKRLPHPMVGEPKIILFSSN